MSLQSDPISRRKNCICSGTKCKNKRGDGVSRQCLLDYYEIETPAVIDVAEKRMEIERKMRTHCGGYTYSLRKTTSKSTRQSREKKEPPECEEQNEQQIAQKAFDEVRVLLDSINGSPDDDHYEQLIKIFDKTPFVGAIPVDIETERAICPELVDMAKTNPDWDDRRSKMFERIGVFLGESRTVMDIMMRIKFYIGLSEFHRTIEKHLNRRKIRMAACVIRNYVRMKRKIHNE